MLQELRRYTMKGAKGVFYATGCRGGGLAQRAWERKAALPRSTRVGVSALLPRSMYSAALSALTCAHHRRGACRS